MSEHSYGWFHEYRPERADPGVVYFTNGLLDFYDLAHGVLKRPQGGHWFTRDKEGNVLKRFDDIQKISPSDVELVWSSDPL